MRQSEFKKKLDPELGRYTKKHVYGEGGAEGGGITDVFKSFGSKLFGKTVKSAAKKGAKKAVTAAATKTGEYAGKKAGDKIVQMLSMGGVPPPKTPLLKNPPAKKVTFKPVPKNTQQDINRRVNAILSGGKIIL